MSKPSTKAGKHPQTSAQGPRPRGSAPSARSVATVPDWKTAIAFTAQPWQPQEERPIRGRRLATRHRQKVKRAIDQARHER